MRWKTTYCIVPRRLAMSDREVGMRFVGWVWLQRAYLTKNINHGWVAFLDNQTPEYLDKCQFLQSNLERRCSMTTPTREQVIQWAKDCRVYMDYATYPANSKELERFAAAAREDLEKQLAAAQAENVKLREFIEKVAEQTPEKPDYWSSCSQCEHNSSDAEDLISQPTDTSALESMIQKAGEAMRERCISGVSPTEEHRIDARWGYLGGEEGVQLLDGKVEDIRAIPGVTLDDLK